MDLILRYLCLSQLTALHGKITTTMYTNTNQATLLAGLQRRQCNTAIAAFQYWYLSYTALRGGEISQ